MSGKLILIRHGETTGNIAKRLDTRPPGSPLSEKGAMQAEALASAVARDLADAPIAALVSSVALRARQTATAVARQIERDVEVREGLHEAQAGELEDRTDTEAHELFTSFFARWVHGELDAQVPGGESARDVLDRYLPVLTELRGRHLSEPGAGDVLVVSHGAAIRLVTTHIAAVNADFAATNHLENTDSVELTPLPDGGWGCTRWGRSYPPFRGDGAGPVDDPMG